MIPSEIEALIQDVLDGESGPEDRARLESWFRSHPEGEARRSELDALFATLGRVPLAEPPADFSLSVMKALRSTSARGPRAGLLAPWAALLARRPALAFGVPFAIGLAAGALVLGAATGAFGPSGTGRGAVTGSMIPPEAGEVRTSNWTVGSVPVFARNWRREGSTWLRLVVRKGGPLEVVMDCGTGEARVASVEQARTTDGEWSLERGSLRWTVRGPGELLVEFRELPSTPASVRVVLRSPAGERAETVPLGPNPDP